MGKMFQIDGGFFQVMGRIADLIILNIMCVLFCLPIITVGPSLTALSYMTQKMVRDEEKYIISGFWHSFKENFWQGIVVNFIMSTLMGILAFDIYYASVVKNGEGFYKYFLYVAIVIAVVVFFGSIYIYPVLAKFDNTIKRTFKNAFLMVFVHLPQTIIMALIIVVPVVLMYYSDSVAKTGLFLFVLAGFSLVSYFQSVFIVKIFDKYLPKEETDEADGDETEHEEAETEEQTEE